MNNKLTFGDYAIVSLVFGFAMLIGCIVGLYSGEKYGIEKMKKEMVERGVAEYNATNGTWQYK